MPEISSCIVTRRGLDLGSVDTRSSLAMFDLGVIALTAPALVTKLQKALSRGSSSPG